MEFSIQDDILLARVTQQFDNREPRWALIIEERLKTFTVRCPLCFKTHVHGYEDYSNIDLYSDERYRVKHCAIDEVVDDFRDYSGYRIVKVLPNDLIESEYYRDSLKLFVLYRHYDKNDKLLYIGITNNPSLRFSQHRRSSDWYEDVVDGGYTKYQKFSNREDLMIAEIQAIKSECPVHNRLHGGVG